MLQGEPEIDVLLVGVALAGLGVSVSAMTIGAWRLLKTRKQTSLQTPAEPKPPAKQQPLTLIGASDDKTTVNGNGKNGNNGKNPLAIVEIAHALLDEKGEETD